MIESRAMLGNLKTLGRETIVYGLSTVVARLLNFLLLPFYTYFLVPADYGVVATIFSCIAFLNVLYTRGMDLSFMRHSPSDGGAPRPREFSTAFWSLAASSLVLSVFLHLLAGPLAGATALPGRTELIRYAAWILAFDTLALVPFAQLRLSHKAEAFAGIKVLHIILNISLNYVFIVTMGMGVKGVFLAALITSAATFIMLAPVLIKLLRFQLSSGLHKEMLRFAWPLVPAGLAATAVQVIDRPILQAMTDSVTVGLYQANYKLGIFMMMVVNMFDAAWRPFFLQNADKPGGKALLARVLTYFTLGASLVFLGISFFINEIVKFPIFMGKPLIHPAYWGGLHIVPIILLAYLINGIYVNMLAPVILAKKSGLIAAAAAAGAVINVISNLLLIPYWGIQGAAVSTLASYLTMTLVLFITGRRVYPIPYEYVRLAKITFAVAAIWAAGLLLEGRFINPATWALVRLGLIMILPIFLALSGFMKKDEREALGRIANRL